MRLYLAASLFSPFERRRNGEIAQKLVASGHKVFLPQSLRTPRGRRPAAKTIFKECVREIHRSDLIVGLVDGPDVDSGTAWELGYAYALNKRIVTLRADYRGAEQGSVNIMIEFASDKLVRSVDPLSSDELAIARLLESVQAYAEQSKSDSENDVCQTSVSERP